jgi:anti-anti-sigma regulatory factor
MLKISEIGPNKQTITLRLEGHIVGPWVDELKQVCEPLLKNGCRLALDLADVAFVDEAGVTALTNLFIQGAKLLNATPFVEAQLNGGVLHGGGSRAARTPPAQ